MVKQVDVSFEFDPETETVSNLKCFVNGVEKKKTTTRSTSKEKKPAVLEDESIVTLESNKLVFNNKATQELGLTSEHRVIIKYEKIDGNLFPVIGSDETYGEEGNGNKFTKSQTVSCRGNANKILKEYGEEFKLDPFKDGLFKLVSSDGVIKAANTYEDNVKEVDEMDLTVYTKDEDTTEIGPMGFTL